MTGTRKFSRIAAVILAVVFTIVTVFSVSSATVLAAGKPGKVTGVQAVAKSSSSIKIKWKTADGAEKYQVYRATSKSGKYKKVKTTTGKSFTNKGLKSCKKYYYKVCAVNDSGKGDFSSVNYAMTDPGLKQIAVDKSAGTVKIKAKVNGKYFKNSTRHLMICKKSKFFNSGKAILDSYCTPEQLYKALAKAGGISWSKSRNKALKDGEKITKSNAENKNYSHMEITIKSGSKEYDLSDCLTTKKGGKKAPKIDMVFSGNPKAADKTPSGCMVCLDSCYIGIVSNDSYGLCDIDNNKPSVYGRSDVLPKNGKTVTVTFKLK